MLRSVLTFKSFLLLLKDKAKARGKNSENESSKKRAAVSTEEECPQKVARTGGSSDTRRLENISGHRRRVVETKEVKVMHFLRARDVKKGAVLLLEWENPEIVVYVRLSAQYLNARRFEALSSHGEGASMNVYEGRSCVTVCEAWRVRQDEWSTGKGHAEVGMVMPVVCNVCEAVYVTKLAQFARDVKAG